MEFKFTVLDYQTRAADAVVKVFDGQPKIDALSYVRDIGTGNVNKHGQTTMGAIETNDGVATDDGTGFQRAVAPGLRRASCQREEDAAKERSGSFEGAAS